MGAYHKLPPRECNNCHYHASGSAFVKSFGRWYYGKEKCPICSSSDIISSTFRALPPPAAPLR